MTVLYPLKFQPIFKDKIWGGNKISSILGKDYGDLPNCGETWELSGVAGNVSTVLNGELEGTDLNTIISTYGDQLLGKHVASLYGQEFPLLIKFIDANQDLSIQVHPDDTIAQAKHQCKGKTEMWYVMQADEGASLISGFNTELTKEQYLDHFENGQLDSILNREQVQDGDTFFIP
ncbi:MAG: type I phosphomannose isomerase catalytic subunit, partial [Bacteroidota bacterium]